MEGVVKVVPDDAVLADNGGVTAVKAAVSYAGWSAGRSLRCGGA